MIPFIGNQPKDMKVQEEAENVILKGEIPGECHPDKGQ
tara:strand:- start:316 stop:429 length:114 start_codon:yes stop_codon:yes gene_type:complete